MPAALPRSPKPASMSMVWPVAGSAAHHMAEFWSTHARTSERAAKGQPEWPAYMAQTRAPVGIDGDCAVVNDPYPLERKLWERLDS